MPSGAKRRKAAKKKKENITNPITEEHGNGDSSKSHDEKDSDSGSVSSPTTSQEHHNPLKDDDEEHKSAQPHDGFVEKPDLGDDGEVEVTKEVDFETRVVDVEPWKEPNVEIVKEGGGGSSNGGVEKKITIESKDGVKESGEEAVDVVDVNVVEKIGGVEADEDREEEKVLPQSNGTSVEINNGGGDTVESQSPQNSDNQPKDAAPVPPVVRPASWKSCCGLFDVVMGSSR